MEIFVIFILYAMEGTHFKNDGLTIFGLFHNSGIRDASFVFGGIKYTTISTTAQHYACYLLLLNANANSDLD